MRDKSDGFLAVRGGSERGRRGRGFALVIELFCGLRVDRAGWLMLCPWNWRSFLTVHFGARWSLVAVL